MIRRMYIRSRIPMKMHEAEVYYMIDYDFKGAHGQKPHPEYTCFYKKFKEAFGQKLAKFRSTASVITMPTLEDALKAAELVEECGGTANVRRCTRIMCND